MPDPSPSAAPGKNRYLGFFCARHAPLAYVNNPKSACTTIKNIIYWLDYGTFYNEPLAIHKPGNTLLNGRNAPEKIAERLRDDLVFTFVRHPLRRAYSCFNEKIFYTGPYAFGSVRDHLVSKYGAIFDDVATLEQHRGNFVAFLKFASESYRRKNGWRRDPHWSPQMMTIERVERVRQLDFIGRIEDFERQFQVVLGLGGVAMPSDVPRMNEGPPAPFPYAAIVDDQIIELGADLFADDLRLFGYDIEDAGSKPRAGDGAAPARLSA